MSRRYYKIKFKYDDGFGNIVEETIYHKENNTTDTEEFYNDKGNIIKLEGSVNYMKQLGCILTGTIDNSIEITTISLFEFNSIFRKRVINDD